MIVDMCHQHEIALCDAGVVSNTLQCVYVLKHFNKVLCKKAEALLEAGWQLKAARGERISCPLKLSEGSVVDNAPGPCQD